MKLFKNTFNGYQYLKWSKTEALCYLLRGLSRESKICPTFFEKLLLKSRYHSLKRFFDPKHNYFNFNGAIIPDVSDSKDKLNALSAVFEDVLLISCYYNENYSKELVRFLDDIMTEGPYGYVDGDFDVRVKKEDIVIDAGAWIGDFSAYAASKEAICYAFEPTNETYKILCKTRDINTKGKIIPIKYGLSDTNNTLNIVKDDNSSWGNKLIQKTAESNKNSDLVEVVTLDFFVELEKLEKVDFIKSDIEGFERNLLIGARKTLKNFAPKLSICTYHLPDDPQVLEAIIKEANPNYKIIHLKHKLFASV